MPAHPHDVPATDRPHVPTDPGETLARDKDGNVKPPQEQFTQNPCEAVEADPVKPIHDAQAAAQDQAIESAQGARGGRRVPMNTPGQMPDEDPDHDGHPSRHEYQAPNHGHYRPAPGDIGNQAGPDPDDPDDLFDPRDPVPDDDRKPSA